MSRPETHISNLMKGEWGRLLSILIAQLRDFELAEDCLSEAFQSALEHWPRGIPANPPAWLLKTARRKAIDRIRRQQSFAAKMPDLTYLFSLDEAAQDETEDIADERLRLIFTACHPALDQKTRIALTLRTLCGLTTPEIARAYLDKETTMAQRLARARQKIAKATIPYKTPEPEDWDERLDSVLTVIYLIFNEGYAASSGDTQIRLDLCEEAIHLTRMLDQLRPDTPEILGLRALLLLNHARSPARRGADGASIPLEAQDRSLWNHAQANEGLTLVSKALRYGQPAPFQLQAAISAIHIEAQQFEDTDWAQIVLIYNRLLMMKPNPVIELNRAVAISFATTPQKGLAALPTNLDDYQGLHAARADMLRRCGRVDEARKAYDQAVFMTTNAADLLFLKSQRNTLS